MKAKGARGFWEGFFKAVSFSIDQPLISQYTESRQSQGGIPMNYRPARESDLPSLVSMSQQAIAYFRVNGIDQWQKGEPNKEELCKAIKEHKLYVLENAGKAAAMITLAPGPELSLCRNRRCMAESGVLLCLSPCLCRRFLQRAGNRFPAFFPIGKAGPILRIHKCTHRHPSRQPFHAAGSGKEWICTLRSSGSQGRL